MNIDAARLEAAFSLVNDGLKKQHLPAHMKRRWARALEKAKDRLIEHPVFSWQPERLLIASVPNEKTNEFGCRFYEANESACRRVDKTGLCEAFYEGFPCWHRAAFLLLKIYLGETGETQSSENLKSAVAAKVSTKVDTFG
ncbi:MAG TPA: hypothetical protein VK308_01515 [Pyrinomonadaceae bacterium]|nr:hypothetical protein [Pyrinomonadaceae bacterium]